MIDKNSIKLIMSLRKQTGLSISLCKEIISNCNENDKRTKDIAEIKIDKSSKVVVNNNNFISWISTRFGIYVFKLSSESGIYNNRNIWKLRNKMNEIIQNHQLNYERILNIKVSDDLVILSCISFKYSSNVLGLYFHEKLNEFICRKFAITIISSYSYNKRKIIPLARMLSMQCLSYYVINRNVVDIKGIMNMISIYNNKKTVGNIINEFLNLNKCFINIQRVFIIA
ncbi:elongation factor EF-Ts [Candidatus Hodgkinia cicadicola]|uniref:Elongation factor EF-Ts n=1 Tax=Candidatus Hodgkinia cicadicola TaxID=573658 RepID=A0ABX4MHX3_9HYPH|nr:elongation factor EF-Ts [Candidatus Hodgkinia cicadicola]